MANYQNLKAAISAAIRTNGNQEITGQVLQDVLNSIVSVIGANYTFAGVATPATNPGTPDQNVMYLAMEGGTYTNFNGTVLPAGISLLMWNGSWTSETVMYGDGGVFDISVYKSSGGTLATYADLSAALDGGNNIPASARKGGMSVKFVQSSDNKYIQARLMADSFTTDVTQWQGVDDEPTTGSKNLVRSDGLYRLTEPIKSSIFSEINIERGGLDTTTGEEQNFTEAKGRRVRTFFLKSPFNIGINSGFRIGAILKYALDNRGNISFVSTKTYPSTAPFTTYVEYPKDKYLYRVLFTKEDATSNFTDEEVASMLNYYECSYDIDANAAEIASDKIHVDLDAGMPNINFYNDSYYEIVGGNLVLHLALLDVGDYHDVFAYLKNLINDSWTYYTLPDTLQTGVVKDGSYAIVTLSSNHALCVDSNNHLVVGGFSQNDKCILYYHRGSIQFGIGVSSILARTFNKFVQDTNHNLSVIGESIQSVGENLQYVNADAESILSLVRGGLDTSTGAEQNDATAKGRRVRTAVYLQAPFTLEINSGFRIGALLRYNKNKTFISTSFYPSSAPFTTKITIEDNRYLYRVLFTKEDATVDFTDAEVESMLKSFSGKIDSFNQILNDKLKIYASRDAYLKEDTVISYDSGSITIYEDIAWDVLMVNIPASADKIKVSNYALARFYCFDSNAVNDFTAGHFIGVIPYTANTFLSIPNGTKAIAILLRKSDYPNGYGDIQIDFNDKVADNINEPSYLYSGDMIDLAKRWNINLYKTLGTAKTVQSMAHYGDRLFMLCNSNDLVQIYIYDLNTGNLIQEFLDVDTGSLTAVHCNVSFFGKEFYSGNEKYPLLYTSQWSGQRALLAFNIVENETRDSYTITPVQTITLGNSISVDAIGSGYMDYMYDPLMDKLVAISYHIASQGYYDTENDAHIAIFDMPLISAGSSVELTSVIDSYRIPQVPVRQDMTIFNSKLYLFSGFGSSEWPAYLTVIDLTNKRISNKILISEIYGSIFGEPEGVDIINGNLIVTSNANIGKLYIMNFFG